MSKPNLKPTCPLKLGNLCDERCAWFLNNEENEEDCACAIVLIAQACAGGHADE